MNFIFLSGFMDNKARFKWVFDKNGLNGSLVSGFVFSRWVETRPRANALGLGDCCDYFDHSMYI